MPIYALDGISPEFPENGDFWVAPGAHVMGKVRLGSGVGIWFGAALRGDNEWIEIGDGTNIQENTVCHTDPGYGLKVGKNCTIGHSAILHGCTIGDGALIGMGATILNGAVIGEGALVGAGALVTEGKVIPPRTLALGSPAHPKKELDTQTVASLLDSAEKYRANMRRFRDGLVSA